MAEDDEGVGGEEEAREEIRSWRAGMVWRARVCRTPKPAQFPPRITMEVVRGEGGASAEACLRANPDCPRARFGTPVDPIFGDWCCCVLVEAAEPVVWRADDVTVELWEVDAGLW